MMAATAKPRLVDPLAAFRARCEARAYLWSIGEIDLHEAADLLALAAEASGLDTDEAQRIMADAFRPYRKVQS
jgi:hypothetical protein